MKKIIFAAAILSAGIMTGCSLSFDGTDNSQPAENVQGSENAVTTQGTDTESEEAADPLEEAKDVAAMYLKAANAEFDQSMVKLMTDDYAADYEYMKKNMGGDNEYGEDEQISGVRYSFDKDKCGFIDKVNISEEYSKAAELYVTIAYDSSEGEVTSSQYILMVLDKDNDWKVCFAGSKAQAYADGIITDENSEKAEANAQAVYEAAEKAVKELSKDKSYKFEYMNYISTETDKFIEKKKVLSEKLAALQDSIRTEKEEQECADELDEEIRALTKQASEKTYIGGLTKECVDAFVSMVYLYDDQTMKIEFNCEDVIRRALEKYGA